MTSLRWATFSRPPDICAAANLLASLAMATVLAPGTELVANPSERTAYIQSHRVWWVAGWCAWMVAAVSLLAFYKWWASRLRGTLPRLAVIVAAVGVLCDVAAEAMLAFRLPADYETVMPLATILTATVANGLYTIAGVILTLVTSGLHGFLRGWTWLVWTSGAALSLAGVAGDPLALAVATAVLFALFCPWVVVMGWKLQVE